MRVVFSLRVERAVASKLAFVLLVTLRVLPRCFAAHFGVDLILRNLFECGLDGLFSWIAANWRERSTLCGFSTRYSIVTARS
jgi:hypothetical protein